jgi:methyl-accepting chemotaxis protein
MNTLRMALWCVLLASLVALVTSVILLVRQTTAVIAVLPAAVERQIREQGKETRTTALAAIGDTRRELLAEVARTRGDLFARVDRLTDVSERALSEVTASVDAVSGTATELRPVLENAAKITAQVNDVLPMFVDCDHNPDCVYNRYVGVAQSTERAMRAVAETAPETLKSVESTAGSVASIARSWEKQTPLYVRVLGWLGSSFLKIKTLFF